MKNTSRLGVDLLESRTTPAALAGNVLTYTDIDGDFVKIVFTHATMAPADFLFFTGSVDGTTNTPQALDSVDLVGKTGVGFKLTATPQKIGGIFEGDSHANIDTVNGTNTDLGTISVDGNVTFIRAGSGAAGTVGLRNFTALSLGLPSAMISGAPIELKNVASFTVKGDIANVFYTLTGGVKKLTVGGNIVQSASGEGGLLITGDLGSAKIGGSLIGRFGTNPSLRVTGNVGSLGIGGSIVGGDATLSDYQVSIQGDVNNVTIGGDLKGGAGLFTGSLYINGNVGAAKIGGNLIGGSDMSGQLILGQAGPVRIGGSLVGSTGEASGRVAISAATSVTVSGSLIGGAGFVSGELFLGRATMVRIGGSILGGPNTKSGELFVAGSIQSIYVGHNVEGLDYAGGANLFGEGSITSTANIGSITIGGNFISGRNEGVGDLTGSGMISAQGTIGAVRIGGSIVGNPNHPAYITAAAKNTAGEVNAISSITVKGSVLGASLLAGYDATFNAHNTDSGIGSVNIGGNLTGSQIIVGSNKGGDGIPGTADDSAISTIAAIGSVNIGGAFTGLLGDATIYFIYGPIVNKVSIGRAVYTHDALHGGLHFNSTGNAAAESVY